MAENFNTKERKPLMTAPAQDKEYLEQPCLIPFYNPEPIDATTCMVIGPNLAMQNVLRLAERVAINGVTVLLAGESGTGKEVIARLIHQLSPRKNSPFCAINCGAIPQDLIESELFGYEAGAFTGANKPKAGKFETANGGTVFLDEIEVASPALQQKLLRVIEFKEIERLGGKKTKVDIRFIAASNKNLKTEVQEKRFREDLFYRLTVPINIPPLRDRTDDISTLAHFLLLSRVRGIIENAPTRISIPAMCILEKSPWKGNIRELESVLIQAVLNRFTTDDILYSMDLTPFVDLSAPHSIDTPANQQARTLKEASVNAAEEAEKALVWRALEETNWNRKEAARRLEISYKLILNKIKKWKWRKP